MEFNFKQVGQERSSGFDPIPEGRYNVVVNSANTNTSTNGKPMLVVEFSILDEGFKNRKLWHNFMLEGKGMMFLHAYLQAIGSNLISEENVTIEQVISAVEGSQCSVFVEPSTTNTGKPSNNLKLWAAPVVPEEEYSSDKELFG